MQQALFSAPNDRPADGGRVALDAYYTRPEDAAAALASWCQLAGLHRTAPLHGWRVLEPSVGAGAWAQAAEALGAVVWAVDINPEAVGLRGRHQHVGSFLQPLPDGWPEDFDLVLGNPPFRTGTGRFNDEGVEITEDACVPHTERALQLAAQVLYLLPLAIAAGVDREDFWQRHPARHLEVNARRWRFTGTGTAQWDTAMFWWDQRPRTWDGRSTWSRRL